MQPQHSMSQGPELSNPPARIFLIFMASYPRESKKSIKSKKLEIPRSAWHLFPHISPGICFVNLRIITGDCLTHGGMSCALRYHRTRQHTSRFTTNLVFLDQERSDKHCRALSRKVRPDPQLEQVDCTDSFGLCRT